MPSRRLSVPAALSGHAAAAGIVVGMFLAGFLGWAALAELDSGALAQGEIMPSGRVKTVQHLEGGIVAALQVREGEAVQPGQELLRLDDAQARSELAIVRTERTALEALVMRLTAERDGARFAHAGKTGAASVDNQLRLLEARRASLERESGAYAARIDQGKLELKAWRARAQALGRALAYSAEEVRMNRALYQQRFIARPRLLELESREAEVAAALQQARAEQARAEQKITDSELALAKLGADWMTAVLDELRQAEEKLAQAKEKEAIASERLARTRVLAPQEGRIQNLRITTVGGVVAPGGAIADIVPLNDALVVEARIAPDDIDAVHPGLPSRVRLPAYRARTHRALDAVVTQVSADTVRDERRNVSYYTARLELLEPAQLAAQRIALTPGMQAQVEIVTGRRSVLRYIFDPLLDSARRGFWED